MESCESEENNQDDEAGWATVVDFTEIKVEGVEIEEVLSRLC